MVLTQRLAAACAITAALALAPATTRAQGGENKAVAESLFQKGKELMAQGKLAEACPTFEESERLDPSVGTMLNLARCHEQLGRTASAWAEYKQAATMARVAGQTDREEAAKELAGKLEAKVSYLRIDVKGATAGLVVKRNGEILGAPALGIEVAVDPGKHTIDATAPGYKGFSTTIEIGAEADRKTVEVPALEVDPNANDTASAPKAGKASGASGLRTAAYVAGGLGIAALGVGAVFGGLAASDMGKADAQCPNKKCTAEGWDLVQAADSKALVSTIGMSIGGAAIGAGVVLFLLSRSPGKEGAKGAFIVPSFGPQGGGAALVGAF